MKIKKDIIMKLRDSRDINEEMQAGDIIKLRDTNFKLLIYFLMHISHNVICFHAIV